MVRLLSFATLVACVLALSACGGGRRAVRGDDVAGLDYHAMSTSLDRRDLQKAVRENLEVLRTSAIVQRWTAEERPGVAVLPMRNETSEHIDSALDALITDVETYLINWGMVRMISLESQPQLMEEIRRQNAEGFDQSKVSHWGQQVGARYFVDGKVFSTDERVGDQRRVQYYMFMRVLSVESGELLFQNKVAITKAIIRD